MHPSTVPTTGVMVLEKSNEKNLMTTLQSRVPTTTATLISSVVTSLVVSQMPAT